MQTEVSVYVREGFADREDYLNNLAEDFGLPAEIVFAMAELLGEVEDFDGLVTECDDLSLSEEYL